MRTVFPMVSEKAGIPNEDSSDFTDLESFTNDILVDTNRFSTMELSRSSTSTVYGGSAAFCNNEWSLIFAPLSLLLHANTLYHCPTYSLRCCIRFRSQFCYICMILSY
jgi:hypothetical protein